ncbi:MAG: Uma2 family endonuclease [Candidatus Xenobia bacterium]
MSDPIEQVPDMPEIAYDHLITEDGAPVESVFQDKQMRMLVDILYASWHPGRPFVAFADVGLFGSNHEAAIVPDVMASLDVQLPEGGPLDKENRSYYVWRFGKAPDVVIEIVSGTQGGEEEKMTRYGALGVSYVVIYDPEGCLSNRPLRCWELHGRHYVDFVPSWLPDFGLGGTVWTGEFEGMHAVWLRWTDRDGNLLPTPVEALQAEQQRADAQRQRADRLAERLRELGVEEV